jgi:hypothetical protein
MRFDYYSGFEDWAEENGYDWDNLLDEQVLLQKTYSRILQFYIANDNGTYARVHAYHSGDEGLHDISIEAEGLKRIVSQVMTEKVSYQ